MFEEFGVENRDDLILRIKSLALSAFPKCHVFIQPVYSDTFDYEEAPISMALSTVKIDDCIEFMKNKLNGYDPATYGDMMAPLSIRPLIPEWGYVDITDGLKPSEMFIDCGPNLCKVED